MRRRTTRPTKKPRMPRTSSAPEKRPAQSSRLGLRLSRSPKNLPAVSSTPIHNVAPIPSNSRKRPRLMPFCPATGGANVASPGTNLAIISVTSRRRPKESWVLRTQTVGSSDSLHKMRKTWWPYLRPIRNQEVSATSEAARQAANASGKLSSCWAERAPAASSTGVAGSGMPNCSTKTQANSKR